MSGGSSTKCVVFRAGSIRHDNGAVEPRLIWPVAFGFVSNERTHVRCSKFSDSPPLERSGMTASSVVTWGNLRRQAAKSSGGVSDQFLRASASPDSFLAQVRAAPASAGATEGWPVMRLLLWSSAIGNASRRVFDPGYLPSAISENGGTFVSRSSRARSAATRVAAPPAHSEISSGASAGTLTVSNDLLTSE